MSAKSAVRNTTWAELKVGDTASIERTCSVQDLILFAHVSGNLNPLMLPSDEAGRANRAILLAPSMWVGSLVSAVLGNILPGPGTLYRAQNLRFLRRVHVGDRVTVTVVCREKREAPVAVFDTQIVNAVGADRLRGSCRDRGADRLPGHRGARPAGVDRRLRRSFRGARNEGRQAAAAENRHRLSRTTTTRWAGRCSRPTAA